MDRKTKRSSQQNIDPIREKANSINYNFEKSSEFGKTHLDKKNSDIFFNANNRDERLNEIEKIRAEFAKDRKRTIQDFERDIGRHSRKHISDEDKPHLR